MKTRVLLIGAICALSVISCSTERDEQTNENQAQKLDLKKKEINNQPGTTNKSESDTIKVDAPSAATFGSGLDPDPGTDPDSSGPEIVHPGDVKPPKP